jgi:hypothetical protein
MNALLVSSTIQKPTQAFYQIASFTEEEYFCQKNISLENTWKINGLLNKQNLKIPYA